jgi:hypothetical protein
MAWQASDCHGGDASVGNLLVFVRLNPGDANRARRALGGRLVRLRTGKMAASKRLRNRQSVHLQVASQCV